MGPLASPRRGSTVCRMADAPGGAGPSVSIIEATAETYDSALALAKAFGAPVFEPAWWPVDVCEISYVLERLSSRDLYRVGSTRHDGVPICVIGQRAVPGAGRAVGEWYEPPELATMRGLIGRVGIPTRLQAVLHREDLALHLIGYDTEEEITRAAMSLRRTSAA